jgi:peptide/nickel transport system permease protein
MLVYTPSARPVVPVVFAVALVCFLLVHIALAIRSSGAAAHRARRRSPPDAQAYGSTGLPFSSAFIVKAPHGDLGTSIATGRAVAEEVGRAVGNTVMLAMVAH